MRQKAETVVLGPGESGNEELMFNGYRVSVFQDEKCSEMYGAAGWPKMQVYVMPFNFTLKND